MSRGLNQEQLEAFRVKYRKSNRARKKTLLDEFVSVTGCHRKHVIRVLKRKKRVDVEHKKKRGRKSKYEFPDFVKICLTKNVTEAYVR